MGAELLHAADAELGEGPRWDHRSDELIWVDILAGEVHMLDLAAGQDRVIEVGRHVGAALPRASGGFALAIREGFCGLTIEGEGETLGVVFEDSERRMNDARCDRSGRLWGSSMTYDQSPGRAALHRLDADHSLHEVVTGVSLGNGLDWSPDDREMYFVDTPTRRVDRFDFDLGTGNIRNRRSLVDLPPGPGVPDGLTVDSEGCIWVALYGGGRVERYTPGGRLDTIVEIPGAERVTSPGFGGPGLDLLFVTTASEGLDAAARRSQPNAGAIFAVSPGVGGLSTSMYAG